MSKVRDSRVGNPDRAPRIYENGATPGGRFCNRDVWERPEGAPARMTGTEATAVSAPSFAPQTRRLFARLVWGREAPDHVNSAAPEAGEGRLRHFLARIISPRF